MATVPVRAGTETESTETEAEPSPLPRDQLKPSEKKALLELRLKLEDAIRSNRLLNPHHRHHRSLGRARVASSSCSGDSCPRDELLDISLWGVPLLPSKRHDATDTLLLKFLRPRDFNPSDALETLRKTLRWRREFGADGILDEDLASPGLLRSAFVHGTDKEGRAVCYNIYSVFRDGELYDMTFGSEERRERFVRWSVQSMEKAVQQLSFKPGGSSSMVLITDVRGWAAPRMKEMRAATKKAVAVFQENYPELIVKKIFVNVSCRCCAYHALFSHFIRQKCKGKIVYARPSKVTETLLKFIAPEKLPVQYGGLKREDDDEFTSEDGVSEFIVKGGCVGTIEIPAVEPGVTVVWDVSVVGWEVNYKEEFIPDDECSYKVLIQKEKKVKECVRNSFYINEPGKVVLTIKNQTFGNKKVLHRSKSKPTIPLYSLLKQMSHPHV